MPITFIPLPNSLPFPIIQKYEAKNPEGDIVHKFSIKRHVDKEKQTEFDITFRSKVISRLHAELIYGILKLCNSTNTNAEYGWMIKDVGSSSGTFINGKRLSPANQPSSFFQLNHHDQLQLGVDYQQRHEDIYKSVKCKIELNQEYPLLNHTRYQELNLLIKKLYTITHQTPVQPVIAPIEDQPQMDIEEVLSDLDVDMDAPSSPQLDETPATLNKRPDTLVYTTATTPNKMEVDVVGGDDNDILNAIIPEDNATVPVKQPSAASTNSNPDMNLPECCICLMPLKLYHGLFISPCCHLFHYHCVRQLCVGHFLCPM